MSADVGRVSVNTQRWVLIIQQLQILSYKWFVNCITHYETQY